jgi:methylmalonyl-CoA mutase
VLEVAPSSRPPAVHAVTSAAMITIYDPWVNILRSTVACFAAGIGGADSITVAPFDQLVERPNAELGRRLARNTQSILALESNLTRVLDPAAGSAYVEQLTSQLAEAGWAWFQEIEAAGGFRAAVDSGLIASRLAETWELRRANIDTRRDPITGVSEFPNLAEQLPSREPFTEGVSTGGLPRVRAAQAFEELRDGADGRRVYLATIGPVAKHTARASFAGNLFQAGGLETPSGDGVEGFAAASTTVACICGTDKDYAETAAGLAADLKKAGATQVWLAGKPDLEVDGVDGYLYAGCDALEVLRTVHDELGAKA